MAYTLNSAQLQHIAGRTDSAFADILYVMSQGIDAVGGDGSWLGTALTFNGDTGVNTVTIPNDKPDALSIVCSFGDLLVFDTSDLSLRLTCQMAVTFVDAITITNGVTISTGGDLIFSGTTGQSQIVFTANLADAMSVTDGVGDLLVFDTRTGARVITIGGGVAGDSVQVGGVSTAKVGFFNVAPVVRAGAFTQTYATASHTQANPTGAALTMADGAGTNDNTIGAITGDASVIAAFQEVVDEINKLIADVANTKQVLNGLIDDLQLYGLAQ